MFNRPNSFQEVALRTIRKEVQRVRVMNVFDQLQVAIASQQGDEVERLMVRLDRLTKGEK